MGFLDSTCVVIILDIGQDRKFGVLHKKSTVLLPCTFFHHLSQQAAAVAHKGGTTLGCTPDGQSSLRGVFSASHVRTTTELQLRLTLNTWLVRAALANCNANHNEGFLQLPEQTSTYQRNIKGWMLSGQKTIFC